MSELAPAFRQQFFDNNGLPLAGGFVYSYIAGTTTPLATYTDETGLTPNANPVVLDSSGTASIWMANASYKFILKDSLGNTIGTVDEVLSTAGKIAAAVNVAGALDILNNLSDVNNAQTSLNNLVGTQTSGKYLRSNGTNVSLSAIQTADLPSLGTNVVTNTNLAQMNSNTIKGNNTGSAANAADLTVTQVNTMLGTLTNPMTTSGDIIIGGSSGTPARLAVGSNTNLLTVSSGAPAWEAIPTWNQNTTGTSATFTGSLTGDVTSTAMATTVGKINGTALSGLATGILKNTTTTGVPSIATAGTDYVIPSGNITGTAANITGTSNATLTSLSALTTANALTSATSLATLSALTTVGTIGTGTWAGTTVAVAHGGTGQTSNIVAPTATTVSSWDANKNLSANATIDGFTTTATAAGTTTMTVGSTKTQYWTGTTTQTVKLPTTSIVAGQQHYIVNQSTGVVTIQSSGANTIVTLSQNTAALFTALVATPTSAANWDFEMAPSATGSSSGNVWTSTGATSAPTWQAPGAASATTGLVCAAHVAAWTGGTPSGEWGSSAGSTLGAFNANTSASANTLDITTSTFGTPQTANSNLPQITVNSLIAGTYKVTVTFFPDFTAYNQAMAYAINDGTNSSGLTLVYVLTAPWINSSTTIIGTFKYTSTANKTFSIWGLANGGEPQINMESNGGANQMNWIIEKVT